MALAPAMQTQGSIGRSRRFMAQSVCGPSKTLKKGMHVGQNGEKRNVNSPRTCLLTFWRCLAHAEAGSPLLMKANPTLASCARKDTDL